MFSRVRIVVVFELSETSCMTESEKLALCGKF